jgi:hypothetical protein
MLWYKFWQILFSDTLHWWYNNSRLKKVNKCKMLKEKLNATFSILLIPFMVRIRKILADHFDWDFWLGVV